MVSSLWMFFSRSIGYGLSNRFLYGGLQMLLHWWDCSVLVPPLQYYSCTVQMAVARYALSRFGCSFVLSHHILPCNTPYHTLSRNTMLLIKLIVHKMSGFSEMNIQHQKISCVFHSIKLPISMYNFRFSNRTVNIYTCCHVKNFVFSQVFSIEDAQ